jgi:hypothetical protein
MTPREIAIRARADFDLEHPTPKGIWVNMRAVEFFCEGCDKIHNCYAANGTCWAQKITFLDLLEALEQALAIVPPTQKE